MTSAFLTPVSALSGVGPARLESLRARGIATVLDLLLLAPLRYRSPPPLSSAGDLAAGRSVSLVGSVSSARRVRQRRGGSFLDVRLDACGRQVRVCFYNRGWLKDKVGARDRLLVSGRVTAGAQPIVAGTDLWRIASDDEVETRLGELMPVHPVIPGVAEGTLRRLIRQALDVIAGEKDPLPAAIRERLALAPLADAVRRIHEPATREEAERGGARLLFDRLLSIALATRAAGHAAEGPAPRIQASPRVRERILSRLPFVLTPGQRAALEEILGDMDRPFAMRRLLLGDVGSGKTAVAAGALLATIAAGAQALLVAPTDVLAAQHEATLGRWLEGSRVRIGFLSSRVSAPEKRAVKAALAAGRIDLLIGTHAALAADVRLPRLGLAVFDEQHRFGVLQRLAGRNKAERPHLLALSATPIPRSLCLGLFGELAITRIEGRPGGRPPPSTAISTRDAAYSELRAAVARGERAFVIFPSIASAEAPAVEREGLALMSSKGPLQGLSCGILHGALRSDEQTAAFNAFSTGAVQVLIATVIVEVGVDVPEATIMVVEGAERFGLATLHQLRGRVGRGARPGHLHLVPSERAREGGDTAARVERLELLERETDGFRIAEADLELRGPGDWCGVRQHGFGGSLPLAAGRDAGFIDDVAAAARELTAQGYHGRHAEYFSALSAAIGGIRFEPKDAV